MKNWFWILVVFLSTVAMGQGVTPTQVRSVTSLPASCNPGDGSHPTDEVSLVSGGTSQLYWCKDTDTWTSTSIAVSSPLVASPNPIASNGSISMSTACVNQVWEWTGAAWTCASPGSGAANQAVTFANVTSVTLTVSSSTVNILWDCYDNNSPANAIYPTWVEVNPYVVTFNFAVAQSGYCVVNNSGGGGGGGGVNSVYGTTNQLTSSGGPNPVLSIPSTFIAPGSVTATTFSGSGAALSDIATSLTWYDPRSYGAKCDGGTDDHVALTAWISAMPNFSKAIIPGNCSTSVELSLAGKSFLSFDGTSQGAGINYTGSGRSALSLLGADHITVRDITIVASNSSSPPKAAVIMGRTSGSDFGQHVFDNVMITGYATQALVYNVASELNSFKSVIVTLVGGGALYAVYTSESDDLSLGGFTTSTMLGMWWTHSTIYNDGVTSASAASFFVNAAPSCGNITFKNGFIFSNAGAAFRILNNGSDQPLTFEDVYGEFGAGGTTYGLYLDGGVSKLTAKRLNLYNPSGYGVYATASSRVAGSVFEMNRFYRASSIYYLANSRIISDEDPWTMFEANFAQLDDLSAAGNLFTVSLFYGNYWRKEGLLRIDGLNGGSSLVVGAGGSVTSADTGGPGVFFGPSSISVNQPLALNGQPFINESGTLLGGNGNIVANGDFEYLAALPPYGWHVLSGATLSYDTSTPYAGARSLIVATASTQSGIQQSLVPATAGQVYIISGALKTASGTPYIAVCAYNSDGHTFLGCPAVYYYSGSGWQFGSATGTLPATTAWIAVISSGSAASQTYEVDSISAYIVGTPGVISAGPVVGPGFTSSGTTFTSSGGLDEGTLAGGATAGTFTTSTLTTGSTVITMGGGVVAPHGWHCSASDITHPLDIIIGTSTSTATATLTIASAITVNDVIEFSCIGY